MLYSDKKPLISADEDEIFQYKARSMSRKSRRKYFVIMEVSPIIFFLFLILLCILMTYPFWSFDSLNNIQLKPTIFDKSPQTRLFIKPQEAETLECSRFFNSDADYIKRYSIKGQRLTHNDSVPIAMDCESIKRRNYFPDQPASKEEAEFPIARARIVFKDYVMIEMELATAYAPQNHYCFAVDAKSSPDFHSKMRKLSECLPNVILTKHEFKVDSAGHNMGPSYLECLKLLNVPEKKWKFVSQLQNHDITLRTNLETVSILRWMNGSNDVEITMMPGGRVNESLDWSFSALKLFKNESRNNMTFNSFEPKLIFSKGYVASTLSRKMVKFMLEELDLTELMRRIEMKGFGVDEVLFSTLQAADALAVPGGFTHVCVENKTRVTHITRKAVWYGGNRCLSKNMRHSVCVFGVEDLAVNIPIFPHLFINKLMPEFDFAASVCWYEHMFNRTHLEPPTIAHLDPHYYINMAHIRFQYLKDKDGIVSPEKLKTFDCVGKRLDMW